MTDGLKKIGFLILEIVAFLLIALVIGAFLYAFFAALSKQTDLKLGNIDSQYEGNPYEQSLVSFLPVVVTYITAIYLNRKFVFVKSRSGSGLTNQNVLSSLWFGFSLGIGLVGFGFIVLLSAGQITLLSPKWDAHLFFGYLLLFFVQSFSEELLMRGFLLPAIAGRFGQYWGIFWSSCVFSLMHLGNPNFAWIGAIDIFLSGILFGILFYRFNNIWACTGLHWSWNFVQATFFDFNVSGINVYSFVQFKVSNVDWLSGGSFGYEGSILSTIVLVVGCVWQGRHWVFSRGAEQNC